MKQNNFSHRIPKEAIRELPIAQFNGDVILVQDETQVPEAVAYLSQFRVLGVDTETKPCFNPGERRLPALLQIATEERAYLFRTNKIGLPQGVAEILDNPNIAKVGLAFKDDLNGLRKHRRFTAKNCIDIQKIVLNYGILDLGLQNIFAIVFGQRISKTQRLTNWENEILTPEQQRYAATDAWATLRIYQELKATEPLPQKEAQALRQADIQRLVAHQQRVMAERGIVWPPKKKEAPSNSPQKGRTQRGSKTKKTNGKDILKKA